MKKILLAAFILYSICLGGCKKEAVDLNKVTAEKIIGKWKNIKTGYEFPIGSAEDIVNYDDTFFHFNADGTLNFVIGNDNNSDEWEVVKNGTKLIFKTSPNVECVISQLDEHNLIFYSDVEVNNQYKRIRNYLIKE